MWTWLRKWLPRRDSAGPCHGSVWLTINGIRHAARTTEYLDQGPTIKWRVLGPLSADLVVEVELPRGVLLALRVDRPQGSNRARQL